MNNQGLDDIIRRTCNLNDGEHGHWKFEINDIGFICIADENYNRMRIISPIVKMENIGQKEIMNCMEANFHTALDAKYAISDGVLWAAFLHPLKELTESQVMNAISQVYSCAKTFGTTYCSSNLIFPRGKDNG